MARRITEEHRRKLRESHLGQIAWNKGLTKDDPRVENYAKKIRKSKIIIRCSLCKRHYAVLPCRKFKSRFCSVKCRIIAFTKLGEKNVKWKGENAGYGAKHDWIKNKFGKANKCEFCLSEGKRYTWANKSKEYKRDLSDWMQLCYSCHKLFDLKRLNEKQFGKSLPRDKKNNN